MVARLALAVLLALALAPTAAAHPKHCIDPPAERTAAGGLRLRDLGTVGSFTGVHTAPGEPGRLYLAGLHGAVWVLEGDSVRPEAFLDISHEIGPTVDPSENERGLQSIAFAPDYARSRLFYFFFSDLTGDSQVVEMQAKPDGRSADLTTWRTILLVPHSFAGRHYGGQLAFGPDGRLYVSLGEAQRPAWAQRRTLYGSIVALDPRRPRSTLVQVARGLRNPYRFTFDPSGRRLIIADVGESQYEEIDVLPLGRRRVANFGWPYFEGPRRHRPVRLRGYVRPRLHYSHRVGNAIIGGPFTSDGRYVFGDFCDGWIATTRFAGRRAVMRRTGLVAPGISAFGNDALGRVYVGSAYGRLYRIEPAAPSGPSGL